MTKTRYVAESVAMALLIIFMAAILALAVTP